MVIESFSSALLDFVFFPEMHIKGDTYVLEVYDVAQLLLFEFHNCQLMVFTENLDAGICYSLCIRLRNVMFNVLTILNCA